jgi:hypothetical protein
MRRCLDTLLKETFKPHSGATLAQCRSFVCSRKRALSLDSMAQHAAGVQSQPLLDGGGAGHRVFAFVPVDYRVRENSSHLHRNNIRIRWCSGFRRHVESQVQANGSDKHTISIFRVDVAIVGSEWFYVRLEEEKAGGWHTAPPLRTNLHCAKTHIIIIIIIIINTFTAVKRQISQYRNMFHTWITQMLSNGKSIKP